MGLESGLTTTQLMARQKYLIQELDLVMEEIKIRKTPIDKKHKNEYSAVRKVEGKKERRTKR